MNTSKDRTVPAVQTLIRYGVLASFALLLFFAGCKKDNDPVEARNSTAPLRPRAENPQITTSIELDATRPDQIVLVFDVPDISDKINGCEDQEYTLTVFLQPGLLRPDANYVVSLEDLGSPVRPALDLGAATMAAIKINLGHDAEGPVPLRGDRIRLAISNRGTPIANPSDLFRHLDGGCSDTIGGDVLTVLIDNLKWKTE